MVALATAVGVLLPGIADAGPTDPSTWPTEAGSDPELSGTEDTIRFAGGDRYQTNVALNLALRGRGGYPFTTSDRSGDWWGAATCPRAIIVVAGDTFADALAAASLSDPTDRSDQPRVRRVASTDLAFNPPGAFDRVDTAFAPIVVTESARAGATALAASARFTAEDLSAGGCTTAREAIIVGGVGAVPAGVDAELVALGYREVFRVAGTDRYDTAAQVAEALGTGTPLDATCRDVDLADHRVGLGWHGNAVVEYRPSADACRLLPRAVVLADGDTGADALAAGWWTSYWQVPVLLTAPDGSLPAPTRDALSRLPIATLIVLGGTARIPESTVEQARVITSAVAGRVGGNDRYETSLAMARAFGGWWPTGDAADAAGDRVCLAASGGTGAASSGWPDALAAGPFCARLAAAATASPLRLRGDATPLGGGAPAHDAAPILLTPPGSASLPPSVRAGLEASFPRNAATGFGIVLGGAAATSAAVGSELGSLLTGVPNGVAAPSVRDSFVTGLDLSFLFSDPGGSGRRVCQERSTVSGVRWLTAYGDLDRTTFVAERDLFADRLLEAVSVPFCVRVPAAEDTVVVHGTAPGGSITAPVAAELAGATDLSAPIRSSGRASGNGTRFTSAGAPQAFVDLRTRRGSTPVTASTLDLQLSLKPGRTEFTGTATVRGLNQSLVAALRGEARQAAGVWELRGRAFLGASGDGSPLVGGFTATVVLGAGDALEVSWQLDGFPTNAG